MLRIVYTERPVEEEDTAKTMGEAESKIRRRYPAAEFAPLTLGARYFWKTWVAGLPTALAAGYIEMTP